MVPERHPSLCKQDEAYEALLFDVCQRWPTWPCLWRAHEEMDEKGRWQWCHHRLDLLCTLLALSLAVGMLTLEHWELKVMIPGSLVSNSLPNLCLWGSQGRREDQCATPPPSSMSPLINFEFMFVRMSFLTFCLFCLHCTYFLFLSLNKFFFYYYYHQILELITVLFFMFQERELSLLKLSCYSGVYAIGISYDFKIPFFIFN